MDYKVILYIDIDGYTGKYVNNDIDITLTREHILKLIEDNPELSDGKKTIDGFIDHLVEDILEENIEIDETEDEARDRLWIEFKASWDEDHLYLFEDMIKELYSEDMQKVFDDLYHEKAAKQIYDQVFDLSVDEYDLEKK